MSKWTRVIKSWTESKDNIYVNSEHYMGSSYQIKKDLLHGSIRKDQFSNSNIKYFYDAVEYAIIDSVDAADMLKNKIITKEDGEFYNKVLNEALNVPFYLLENKIITKEDGELFNKAKNSIKVLNISPIRCYKMLKNKIITKEDGELFKEIINKAIEDEIYACDIIRNKIITRNEDKELFDKVLDVAIDYIKERYNIHYDDDEGDYNKAYDIIMSGNYDD